MLQCSYGVQCTTVHAGKKMGVLFAFDCEPVPMYIVLHGSFMGLSQERMGVGHCTYWSRSSTNWEGAPKTSLLN